MNIRKLVKKNGIKRIGPKALEKIESYITDKVKEISIQSLLLAKHAGRGTYVTEEDVKLALLVGK